LEKQKPFLRGQAQPLLLQQLLYNTRAPFSPLSPLSLTRDEAHEVPSALVTAADIMSVSSAAAYYLRFDATAAAGVGIQLRPSVATQGLARGRSSAATHGYRLTLLGAFTATIQPIATAAVDFPLSQNRSPNGCRSRAPSRR
jgi:hypothetical protein